MPLAIHTLLVSDGRAPAKHLQLPPTWSSRFPEDDIASLSKNNIPAISIKVTLWFVTEGAPRLQCYAA